jgi:hypothetical protein
MSAIALAIVLGYAVMFGVAPRGSRPTRGKYSWWDSFLVIAFYAIKWLPTQRKPALLVLGLQLGVALAAMFPVWWFRW